MAGACGRGEARFSAGGKSVDHLGYVFADLGQRPAECIPNGCRICASGHGTSVEGGEKHLRVHGGSPKAGGAVMHEPDLTRSVWADGVDHRKVMHSKWYVVSSFEL